MAGKLYIVGTPIGNLGDMSPRAVDTLSSVDFIAAEDTRVTVKLLNHFGIHTPMISYHEHNQRERGEEIVARLLSGETCAIVTDAGMPAVSDPGRELVKLCHERGVAVETVPGPTALITALALSGFESGRFCFEGFLSVNKPRRAEHLQSLERETRTMIFYEAPHKLLNTLKDMRGVFGDRRIAFAKELTKLHENVMITTINSAIEHFTANPPKGEFVLVVDGCEPVAEEELTFEQAVELAAKFKAEGMPASAAASRAAKLSSFKKSEIYSKLI